MRSLAAIGLACLLVYGGACANKPTNDPHPDWILGTWKKTYDPAHDPEESITFFKNGSFFGVVTGTTQTVEGGYAVSEPQHVIMMTTTENGKVVPMSELTFEDAKDKLYYTGKTGVRSYYEKQK